MMLITGAGVILIMLNIAILDRIDKIEYYSWLVVPYLLIHVIGTICCYKEWMPSTFLNYPKDVMQF